MEFIKAIKQIISTSNISPLNNNADKLILLEYKKYCETDIDLLQFQEYKNILMTEVSICDRICGAINDCNLMGDKHFKKLADIIENIADELEKHNISCFSYSYFIYSFINYCIEVENNQDLKNLNIEPIVWIDPENFDYSYQTVYNNEQTFGFGRYKENIKNFDIDQGKLIKYKGKSQYVIIPYFVQEIGSNAFADNNSIRSIYIPNNVAQIDSSAFKNCEHLEMVVLNKNIQHIYTSCFEGCKRLKRINLDNIITVGNNAFKDCVLLSDIKLNNLEKVGDEAFANCVAINDYNFISQLTYIGQKAFTSCKMNIVTLFKCEKLGASAFLNCGELSRVVLDNPIAVIETEPFKSCFNVNYVKVNNLLDIRVHNLFENDINKFNSQYVNLICIKTDKLRNNEFKDYCNVVNIEVLGQTDIPDYSFSGCTKLEDVNFSRKTIKYLGEGAFENCSNLTNLDVVFSGDTIKAKTFYKCSQLKSFDFLNSVQYFDHMSLSYTDLSDFTFDRSFKKIGALAFANCVYPKDINLKFNNCQILAGALHGIKHINSLEIDNLDNLYNKQIHSIFEQTVEGFNNNVDIEQLVVKSNITEKTFANFNNIGNVECNITNGVIPFGAFQNCKVENIKIIGDIKNIEQYSFANCKFNNLEIKCQQLMVGDYAFSHCANISNIDLSKVISFGKKAFEYTDITSVDLGSNTQFIGESAFGDCYNIKNVVLPFVGQSESAEDDNNKYFGYIFNSEQIDKCYVQNLYDKEIDNFYIPSNIKEVTILSTKLPTDCFEGCEGIECVTLPNIVHMENSVFDSSSNLTTLNIGSSLLAFSGLSIINCDKLDNINIDKNCVTIKNVNGSILSCDNKTLYHLHKDSVLEDFLDTIECVGRNAECKTRNVLSLTNKVSIGQHSIDACNLEELSIDKVQEIGKNSFYNANKLQKVCIHNSPANQIIKTESAINLKYLEINDVEIDEISNCFVGYTKLDIQEVKLGSINITSNLFNNVNSVESVVMCDEIPSTAKGMFKNLPIVNLYLDFQEFKIKELFECDNRLSINHITINSGDINSNIFDNCDIQELELIDVDTIHKYAFDNARISQLIINQVELIEDNFGDYAIIKNITITNDEKYKTEDNVLYEGNNMLKCFKESNHFVIPGNIEYVGAFAFYRLNNLKSITINSNIKFEKLAICKCENLSEITLGNIKNTTLGEILDNPSTITKICYNDTNIARKFFSNLTNLQHFSCENLKYVGDLAFAGNKLLQQIDLTHAEYVGDLAFMNCSSLERVEIGENCAIIGYNAFDGCDNVGYVSVPYIGHDIINIETFEYLFDKFSKVQEVCVLKGHIQPNCFKQYKNISSITLPKDIKTIPESAFEEMDLLQEVHNCNNINTIGEKAFYNCGTIVKLDFGKLKKIDNKAFLNCVELKTIGDDLSQITTLGEQAFKSTLLDGEYNLNSITTIKMQAFENSCITKIKFGDKLQVLESQTFKDCKHLTNVDLGNVKDIGFECFANSGLETIDLSNVTNIGEACFMDTRLHNIQLSDELLIIPNKAFYNCKFLKSITLSNNLQEIGDEAFAYTGLHQAKLTMPVTLNKMGEGVFSGIKNLTIYLYTNQDKYWSATWTHVHKRFGFLGLKNKLKVKYYDLEFLNGIKE